MLRKYHKMFKVVHLVFVIHIASSVDIDSDNTREAKYYRVSMVSSPDSPNKPALFSHGESPVWDHASNSLYFVDVHKQNVHRLDYVTGMIHVKHIGYGQVNLVALVSHSSRLLIAVRSAFFLLDWGVAGDAALRLLSTVDHGQPDNVINDGKPDAHGRFWAGTKGPQTGDDVFPDKGSFYSLEQGSLTPRIQLRPVTVSNGIVWSLNNSVLYYIDSTTQKIEAFDFDLMKGDISGRRTIIDITNYGYEDAIPDGMTIDSEGHLWVALMFGGAVLHINPDTRQVIFGYKLPVNKVTSVCWGGPNLDELFVTTSRDTVDFKNEPLGGAIFTIRHTGSRGVPANVFIFDNADSY